MMNIETEKIFLLNTGQGPSSTLSQKLVQAEMPGTTNTSLENVEDFSNVCRTCATVTEFVIPIFSGEGLQNNLAEKIHKHLPIKVSEADVLPRVVCYQCVSTLLAWHELVQCCVQADTALRVHASLPVQESKRTDSKPNSTLSEDTQNNLPSAAPPPQYRSQRVRTRASLRTCPYCETQHAADEYMKHLIFEHSELRIRCKECSSFIDRRNIILHMPHRASFYNAARLDRMKVEPRVPWQQNLWKRSEEADCDQNPDTSEPQPPSPEQPVPAQGLIGTKTEKQTSEFSDHSDTENGFEPLPESVFEAIEDSQHSQPAEEDASQSPAEERGSDDSHSSASPENDTSDHTVDASEGSSTSASDSTGKPKSHKRTRTCPTCSKQYHASSSYFYHMKHAHGGSREHACEVCGQRFGTRGALAQHAPLHTGESRYECELCHKRFRSNAGLYIHAQTHHARKVHKCAQCGSAFRWRAQLQRHAQRHAAERAYVCARCGRGFSVRADMLRHARTHAGGMHFCATCGLSYSQPRYLKVHVQKHHTNKHH